MTAPTVRVRPFADDDYPRYVEIGNAVLPEVRSTEAEARHDDAVWDDKRYHRRRLVADDGSGRLLGWGEVAQIPEQFRPGTYSVQIQVDPAHRRRGVGGALYDALRAHVDGRAVDDLRAEAKESATDSRGFLERRGFVEVDRAWESRLDVAAFDPAPFAGAEERATAQGIAFTTLGAERARRADAVRAAYDLHLVCVRDVPNLAPVTDVDFEHFVGVEVDQPSALPDGYLLALDGNRYVGQSTLFTTGAEPGLLHQGLTGVLPAYRGRGIAMALKLRTVAYARAHGFREIRTWNNTRNRPMLRINEAIGFAKQPAWVIFQRLVDRTRI